MVANSAQTPVHIFASRIGNSSLGMSVEAVNMAELACNSLMLLRSYGDLGLLLLLCLVSAQHPT